MSLCACGMTREPPTDRRWWWSDQHTDPGPTVAALVRWGEDPNRCRSERLDADPTAWVERGSSVAFSDELTVPMRWERVGRCVYEVAHPMVVARLGPGGSWEVSPP